MYKHHEKRNGVFSKIVLAACRLYLSVLNENQKSTLLVKSAESIYVKTMETAYVWSYAVFLTSSYDCHGHIATKATTLVKITCYLAMNGHVHW